MSRSLAHQSIGVADFVAFLSRFGSLAFTPGEVAVKGRSELDVVTKVGRTDSPISNWHVDTGYIDDPLSHTALGTVEVPGAGGAALFSNRFEAYRTLPNELRRRIEGRSMTHVVTGIDPGPGEQHEAEHPLVRAHPRTGRCALWLDAPKRCSLITGLDADRSRELAADLLADSTHDANEWRHHWSAGDVATWDNAAVMRRADHAAVTGHRPLHRGMIASDGYAA